MEVATQRLERALHEADRLPPEARWRSLLRFAQDILLEVADPSFKSRGDSQAKARVAGAAVGCASALAHPITDHSFAPLSDLRPIYGFWHVATISNWHEIVMRQLASLRASGLYDRTAKIFVGAVGPAADSVDFDDPKLEIVFRSASLQEYEFPTLEQLWRHCQEHSCHVYYFHLKGVSRGWPQVEDWRTYLEYFLFHRFEESLRSLNRFDVAGVNWQHLPWPHFSGNFWWACSEYIRRLPAPLCYRAETADRIAAEKWIGIGNPSAACLHQSGVNHYESLYPANTYRHPRTTNTVVSRKDPLAEHLAALEPISVILDAGRSSEELLGRLAQILADAKFFSTSATECDADVSSGDFSWCDTDVRPESFEYRPDILIVDSRSCQATHQGWQSWIGLLRPGGAVLVVGPSLEQVHQLRLNEPLEWFVSDKVAIGVTPQRKTGLDPPDCLLSVLIATLPSRREPFQRLLQELERQVQTHRLHGRVEILSYLDDKSISVGEKRNVLMCRARGRFVVFIDDDDEIDPEYLTTLCEIIDGEPSLDCIGFEGEYCSAGHEPEPTIYSLKYREPTNLGVEPGYRVFLRPPQHVNPIRRAIAIQFPFPDLSCGEDRARAQDLAQSGALRSEYFLAERVMYRYLFDPQLSETQGFCAESVGQ